MKLKPIAIFALCVIETSALGQTRAAKARGRANTGNLSISVGAEPAVDASGAAQNPTASPASTQGESRLAKVPSWMFGLGLTTTPGIPIDRSMTSLQTAMGNLKVNTTIPSDGTNIKAKSDFQSGSLIIAHQLLTSNRRFYVQTQTTVERQKIITSINHDLGGGLGNFAYKSTDTSDTPSIGSSMAFQARPGLWIGIGGAWDKLFKKSENTSAIGTQPSETTKTTQKRESVTQSVGLEFMSVPGHAGIEYAVTTKSKDIETTISVPVRIALSETVFMDLGFKQKNEDDVSDSSKSRDTTTSLSFGQQFSGSAYKVDIEASTTKSWDSAKYSNGKDRAYSVTGEMGSAKGARFGVQVGYMTINTTSSDQGDLSLSGPVAAIYLGLAR